MPFTVQSLKSRSKVSRARELLCGVFGICRMKGESHFEYFKASCGLQGGQWGLEEYQSIIGVLKAMMLQDQLDVPNIVGAEMLFRRLQVIEYSYSDKLKERGISSTGGRLTMEEQSAF
eukprot:2284058-Amphidinium_carterae.1